MDKLPPLPERAEFHHLVPDVSKTEPNLNSSRGENATQLAPVHFPLYENNVQTISTAETV